MRVVGRNIIEGLVYGFGDRESFLNNAIRNLSNNIVREFQTNLEIHSPARVPKYEVGYPIVDGIADGLDENKSAEDAARNLAQRIMEAFREKLGSIDIRTTMYDLHRDLWEALYGDTATEDERVIRQQEHLMATAHAQQERILLAIQRYNEMVATLGASSTEAREAYNDVRREQLTHIRTLNELDQTILDHTESHTERLEQARQEQSAARSRFIQFVSSEQADILRSRMGYSDEDVRDWAMERAGFDPDFVVESMIEPINAATIAGLVETGRAMVSGFQRTTEESMIQLKPTFEAVGESYAQAIGTGFIETVQSETATQVVEEFRHATDAINEGVTLTFFNTGATYADAIGDGFVSNVDSIYYQIVASVDSLIDRIQHSKIFTEFKDMLYLFGGDSAIKIGDGFYYETEYASHRIIEALVVLAQQVENAVASIMKNIARVIDAASLIGVGPLGPTPVIVAGEGVGGYASLADMLVAGREYTPFGERIVDAIARQESAERAFVEMAREHGNTYNTFNQTNVSPKALSRTEIYRQTENQMAQLRDI